MQNCQSSTATGATARQVVSPATVPSETKEGAGSNLFCRARRRFCNQIASQPRRLILGCAVIRFFWQDFFGRFNQWHGCHRLNRLGSNRRHVSYYERTPLAPNDGIELIHIFLRVSASLR